MTCPKDRDQFGAGCSDKSASTGSFGKDEPVLSGQRLLGKMNRSSAATETEGAHSSSGDSDATVRVNAARCASRASSESRISGPPYRPITTARWRSPSGTAAAAT